MIITSLENPGNNMKPIRLLSALILSSFIISTSLFGQNQTINVGKNSFSISIPRLKLNYQDVKKGKFNFRIYNESLRDSTDSPFQLPSQSVFIALPFGSKPVIKLKAQSETVSENMIPVSRFDIIDDARFNEINKQDLIKKSDDYPGKVSGFYEYREFYYAEVIINPVRYDLSTNSIRQAESIMIDVNFGENTFVPTPKPIITGTDFDRIYNSLFINASIAGNYISSGRKASNNLTSWYENNKEYVKLTVGSDGIYRVSGSDLEAASINTSNISTATLKLYLRGQEIPIYLKNNNANSFSADNYFEFYAERNYPQISHRIINAPEEPYNEFLNRYTDSTYYFLTWDGIPGLRIGVNSVITPNLTDTLDYYTHKYHYEENTLYQPLSNIESENQAPDFVRNKTWIFSQTKWFYGNRYYNYKFPVSQLKSGGKADIYYKVISAGASESMGSHTLTLKYNNTTIDSQVINRFDQCLLSGEVFNSQLIEGINEFQVNNTALNPAVNTLSPDWFEIDYDRIINLADNKLIFQIVRDLPVKERVIKIDGVTGSDFTLYRILPTFSKIENFNIQNDKLYFTDSVGTGYKYAIFKGSNILKPSVKLKGLFFDLINNLNSADYICITHPKFMTSAETYTQEVEGIYGLSSVLININDIFDEFAYGFPYPESIRDFLKAYYDNQTLKPEYLCLIGDANNDYKSYRFLNDGVVGGGNYVPSYGNPVSDNWYSVWTDGSMNLPSLLTGRIPINEVAELEVYKAKLLNNFEQPFDEWNKNYILFSGGPANSPSEIAQLKAVNDRIINEIISPVPIAGNFTHFYKTTTPVSDFGPYTPAEFNETIKKGSLIVSYIGHSGTATWDNSISDTKQLKSESGKHAMMTDFGCSTNKFAEPDITAFGERFVLEEDGNALGYIGNSSLGFFSTSTSTPVYFYESLLLEGNTVAAAAHLGSKIKLFQQNGLSQTNRIFAYTSLLMGDPSLQIRLPDKPDLEINASDIVLINDRLNDQTDSVKFLWTIRNIGLASNDSMELKTSHFFKGREIQTFSRRIKIPDYIESINLSFPVKDSSGIHNFQFSVDAISEIIELNENNNYYENSLLVNSTKSKNLTLYEFENAFANNFRVLNPFDERADSVVYEVQRASDFNFTQDFHQFEKKAEPFFTKILFSPSDKARTWLRYRIKGDSDWGEKFSFFNSGSGDFFLGDSLAFSNQILENFQYSENSLKIKRDTIELGVLSAGYYAGANALITKNGVNLLSNSFFAGMGIGVFDPVTFNADAVNWYQLFGNPTTVQELADFVLSIPDNKIVLVGVADEARNNLSTNLRDNLKNRLGSTKIDSLQFRGSWAIIAMTGATPQVFDEQVRGPYNGAITLANDFSAFKETAKMLSLPLSHFVESNSLSADLIQPLGSSISIYPVVKYENGLTDTLDALSLINSSADLNSVNSDSLSELRFLIDAKASVEGVSPEINSIRINYSALPEIGTNYEGVSVNQDTLQQGEMLEFKYSVFNSGSSNADSVRVKIEMERSASSKEVLSDEIIGIINAAGKVDRQLDINTNYEVGERKITVTIDPENSLKEMYKENNSYSKKFYVIGDSTKPTLKVTFDGTDVFDGDYISSHPAIQIDLFDASSVPITDTNSIRIRLDNKPVYYSGNNDLTINYSASNPKVSITYTPSLSDGRHELTLFAADQSGNLADSNGYKKIFTVSNQLKFIDLFNYPNPAQTETFFTFRLSQLPDELKILIYSVSGRLIREIEPVASELKYDFNRIYWDLRDQDGDFIANGVYLAKIVMKREEETVVETIKIAKVK